MSNSSGLPARGQTHVMPCSCPDFKAHAEIHQEAFKQSPPIPQPRSVWGSRPLQMR